MKAIIIGGTGLVGKVLIEMLLIKPDVEEVHVFVRRSTGITHTKLRETIVDFNEIDSWKNQIQGDILFSALGTTIKVAGSKEAQYKVDYQYQFDVARAASQNGVKKYVLISSVNANPKSSLFYLRMKGELDEKVNELGFSSIHILRPGPLNGQREKIRKSEIISTKILESVPQMLVPEGMRPVEATQVAEVAIKYGMSNESGVHILSPAIINRS
jgi:uncharacterized protein YbjT (DUF2867 family)